MFSLSFQLQSNYSYAVCVEQPNYRSVWVLGIASAHTCSLRVQLFWLELEDQRNRYHTIACTVVVKNNTFFVVLCLRQTYPARFTALQQLGFLTSSGWFEPETLFHLINLFSLGVQGPRSNQVAAQLGQPGMFSLGQPKQMCMLNVLYTKDVHSF